MPAKIRLTRHGKKGRPFYHIVVADGRAPRDGRFIEKIGTYNPLTKPADILLDIDKAVDWLNKGAQPTDTVRAILSYKGVLYKNHLLKGVKKGALTEEQAEIKFQAWLKEKEAKIAGKVSENENAIRAEKKKRLEAEAKVKEAKAAEVAKKRAEEAGMVEETAEEAAVVEETQIEEVPSAEASETKEETPAVETEEAVVEETVNEESSSAKASEDKKEVKAEAPEVEETAVEEASPVEEEAKAEEAPVVEETQIEEVSSAKATETKEETPAVEAEETVAEEPSSAKASEDKEEMKEE